MAKGQSIAGWLNNRPLGVEGDVCGEGIDGAVGIGGARATGDSVPACEGVAGPGEGVGVNAVGDVGNLRRHRARAAVAVEGHGVVGQRRPLGVEGEVG